MTKVKFSVSSKASCFVYIDGVLVPQSNDGQGEGGLSAGEHDLIWRLLGSAGATARLTLKAGETKLVEIKEIKVPPDTGVGIGGSRFTVGG